MHKKYAFLLILLGLIAKGVFSQSMQLQWAPNGKDIRQGKHIEWFRSGIPSDDGSVIYTWSDTRNGYRDVFIQKIDSAGNSLFGDNGVPVVSYDNRQEDPVLITDGSGGAIVFWVDFRADSSGDIYAQHIDNNGNQLWNEDGLPICTASRTQISIRLASDDNGGAYAVWLDYRNGNASDIYGIHVTGDGATESGWAENGNPVSTAGGDQLQHSLDKDGAGGAIVVWADTRESSDQNIYAQRLLADGSMAWTENGEIISDAPGKQETPKLVYTGTTGVYAAWRDFSQDSDGDIRSQWIKPDGSKGWEDSGIVICDQDAVQKNPRVTAENNLFFIAWEDFRNDPVDPDIFVQKVENTGSIAWTLNGVAATDAAGKQEEPRLTSDGSGGIYTIWTNHRADDYSDLDIYAQHIGSTGSVTMDPAGGVVCDAPYAQERPLIRPDGDHGAIVAWGDARTGSVGIYIQRIDSVGNALWEVNGKSLYYGIDGNAKNMQLRLGENDELVAFWEDHRRGAIGSHIYMQRVNPAGTPQFLTNGIPLTSSDTVRQMLPEVARKAGDEENYYVAWTDKTSERGVRVLRADADASPLWDEYGIPVENAFGESGNAKVAAIASGGAVVGWSDFRSFWSYQVYLQKYDTDGNPLWTEDGVLVGNEEGDNLLMGLHPVSDGVYVVWQSGTFEDLNLMVDLIGYDGNPVTGWDDGPKAIVDAPGHQTNPVLIPGNRDGLYVLWEDRRGNDTDIYVNRITPDGVAVENGTLVLGGPSDQRVPRGVLCDNGLFVAAQDFRNGTDLDLTYQLFDTWDWMITGDLGYIIRHGGSQSHLDLKKLSDGSILAAWEDDRQLNDSDIYAQWFASSGYGPLWDSTGVQINGAINKQNEPVIVPDSNGGAYIVWLDNRSSGKTELFNIYGQYITDLATGIESGGASLPAQFAVGQNYPNPFNPSTTIPYRIAETGMVTFTIYDLRGAQVWQVKRNHQEAGRYQLHWDGKTTDGNALASGVYFLQVRQNSHSVNRKLILVE